MQQRDHRQLDLFGGNSHPHHRQLAFCLELIGEAPKVLQLDRTVAACKMRELHKNSYGRWQDRHITMRRSRSDR
ncbi:hypothetical protein RSP795_08065 [Ralstonia solanacearum]|uniref:hypothetical protein n=1 Tax=Ralstonia solanacearum TaxID=305 RepID=UPI0007D86331|nr:hypothetical protein [Ralstonia solanacearum]OAI63448.1 hypothetical protein RSP795_08065 [Ralstonia solanacearum]